MRVALVHDYFVHIRGGERTLLAMANLMPDADIYFFVTERPLVRKHLPGRNVYTSFIDRLPRKEQLFRHYLPLYPSAARSFDMSSYDLVVSSSSSFAHWVRVAPRASHVCYCYTPLRYAWSHYEETVRNVPRLARPVFRMLLKSIRADDAAAAQRVHWYITSSTVVKARIQRYYARESVVVPPPVDVSRFSPAGGPGDYYLLVSALVPYKRVDLAVEAFNRLGRRMLIVGDGPQRIALQQRASANIEFLTGVDDSSLARLYQGCRAFVFPTEEDFGITPLEANAAGRPVIALARGGALETVVEGVTGLFFQEQHEDALIEAVNEADGRKWDSVAIRRHAETYSPDRFQQQLGELVARYVRHRTAGNKPTEV